MNESLVSILTPCYNHSKYLEDYFKSIINQDYDNIELIMIDDNSSDDSLEIIESYREMLKERFVRFILIRNAVNKGLTKNCNTLLSNAIGKYIKIFASDDLLSKNAIRECVGCLEEFPSAFACINNGFQVKESFRYGDQSGFLEKIYYSDLSGLINGASKNRLLGIELQGNAISAPCVMLRREAFNVIGGYDESCICEDYDCWMRIIKFGEFCFLNRNLTFYRVSDKSLSHRPEKKYDMIIDDLKVKAKYADKNMQNIFFTEAVERCAAIGITKIEDKLLSVLKSI